jgi:hypothetical protein
MLHSRKIFLRVLWVVIALVIIGYAASKSTTLLEGPQLTLISPANGVTVHTALLPIEGHAKNISFISLNDRQIYVDDTGKLFEQVLLYEGYNIITVKARDKFGRDTTVVREIILENQGEKRL